MSMWFAIPGFCYAIFLFVRWWQARHLASATLTPNCLLTRRPVVFVTGPRSLSDKPWQGSAAYLARHGYEVFNLNLPWREAETRKRKLIEFLENAVKEGRRYHFLCDDWTAKDPSLLERSEACASWTPLKTFRPATLLSRIQELAEQDFTEGPVSPCHPL